MCFYYACSYAKVDYSKFMNTTARRVLTKLFGNREVLAYVIATEKEHGTKRLFFSTVFPENL